VRARIVLFCSLLAAAALTACGGGGGGGSSPVPSTPLPSPSATSSGSGSQTLAVTFGSTTSVPFTSGSLSGTVAVPGGSGTANITFSASADSNTTPLATTRGAVAASVHRMTSQYGAVVYVTLTATGNVTMDGYPGFSVTGTSTPFYVAEYEAGYWTTVAGPSSLSGGSDVLAPTISPVITLQSGQSLYLALYTGGTLPTANPFGCDSVQGALARRKVMATGVQPISSGATASYSGNLIETLYRSAPCPQPTATFPATVSVQVSASPDPIAGRIDETDSEIDGYNTNSTTTITTAVVGTGTSGSASTQIEYGETSKDLLGDTIATTYSTPVAYTVTAPIPYTGAPISNGPPSTVNATLADNSTEDRTYSGTSGAYSETDTLSGGVQNTISVQSSGAASYAIGGATPVTVEYSAPSGGMITATIAFGGTTQTFPFPAWYSGALYSDTITGGAAVTSLPSNCSNNVGATGSYAPVTRTIVNVDPALGTTENETITAYIAEDYPTTGADAGPICVLINDTVNLYYDYLLDTPTILYLTVDGNPVQSDTVTEAYSWTSTVPTGLLRVRSASERAAAMNALAPSIDAHALGIRFARQLERAERIELIGQSIAKGGLGGIK
jgi:hypothetical protein